MNTYIDQTRYAVTGLFSLVVRENTELTILLKKRKHLQQLLPTQYTNFVTMDLHEDFDDAHVMHAFAQWAKTQRHDEEIGTVSMNSKSCTKP